MPLRKKLAITFMLVVTLIMGLYNFLNYYFSRDLLIKDQEKQMDLLAKQIGISIEQSQFGAQYVEDLIGNKLRVAAIAARNALNPDIANVTNEELARLSEELGISHITLMQEVGDDIVGVKSSDPKEINMSTKDWDYWFVAFKQLLTDKNTNVSQGLKLPNFWSGPVNISYTDPDHVDKWGYYFDGTTNYIINPYIRDTQILKFQQILGPQSILEKILNNNKSVLEITGFNPKTFGEPPVYSEANGQKYIDLVNRDIQFGQYEYKEPDDVSNVKKSFQSGKILSVVAESNGKKVLKSFIPISSANPYIIGIVTDYQMIQDILNEQFLNNTVISIIVLLFVLGISFLLANYIARPVNHILYKVNEIAEGNFGAKISINRSDELGLLSKRVNTMSMNLDAYTRELKDKNEEIEFRANYDFLTGLPNIRLFNERFQGTLESVKKDGTSIAVLFLDLDRFKWINDTFGHSSGDYLLKEVARRIADLSAEDEVGSRIGGDEFVLLLPGYTREMTEQKAEQILQLLSQPVLYEGQELSVTPSIGISMFPADGGDIDSLIKNADIAMYRAKEQGRNNYQFYALEMKNKFLRRAVLEKGMRKALERNEFRLHYQPQIDLQTGHIVGVEALIRWIHPEEGMISPIEFIPLAEETGLIAPIGEWILETACSQIMQWQGKGFPLMRVSVNLSARQIQQQNLVGYVGTVLERTGLDPKLLELEITESIAMYNEDYVINKLNSLKRLGLQIAIDDFGTGYSSLNYLNKFPIDTLKIDKSFINQITDASDHNEIITTIIAMARNLKLKVIAEGVETVEQLHYLQNQKCNEAQGYFFSKPLSVEDFELLFRQIASSAAGKVES
ncbi:EAL domain-containing protein [Paenibacillus doosanensis]|uniref:EAL domain-containing protein n=1 Tax=Paenibacillus doosanensis TaxID=1229154 RepID=UPI00217F25C9|nr:EAL domain-containing protein [Paenibacillus doosanensis]MCS7461389.1 EAL domain-containing protein [Paenibacillus doosanensis]